jgi:hypothetical protein
MRIQNSILTLSGTSMAVDIQSDEVWLGHICNFSIQLVFTGTPTGSLKLQCSNDEGAIETNIPNATITNWTDIAGSTQAISAAGNHTWNVQNCGYRWVRFVYTATSGSGTITSARFNVKGV